MNTFFAQIVAFTSSILLTLPVGWCGGSACLPTEADSGEARCCPSRCHGGAIASHEAWAAVPEPTLPPTGRCDCVWEATVPQTSLPPQVLASPPFPTVADHVTPPRHCRSTTPATHLLDHSGPRLHIWHCIWRC